MKDNFISSGPLKPGIYFRRVQGQSKFAKQLEQRKQSLKVTLQLISIFEGWGVKKTERGYVIGKLRGVPMQWEAIADNGNSKRLMGI